MHYLKYDYGVRFTKHWKDEINSWCNALADEYGFEESKVNPFTPKFFNKMLDTFNLINFDEFNEYFILCFLYDRGLRVDSIAEMSIGDLEVKTFYTQVHNENESETEDSNYILNILVNAHIVKDKVRFHRYWQPLTTNFYKSSDSNLLMIWYLLMNHNAFKEDNFKEILLNNKTEFKEEKRQNYLFVKKNGEKIDNKYIKYIIEKHNPEKKNYPISSRSFKTGCINRMIINSIMRTRKFINEQDDYRLTAQIGWKDYKSLYYYKREILKKYNIEISNNEIDSTTNEYISVEK